MSIRNLFLSILLSGITFLSTAQTFTITPVPSENGTYTITPKLPADGKVKTGTVLTVTAKPASGYSLDAIYYRVKGGMWGTLDFENFTSTYKITVDKDMSIGATFVESSLVSNLKVTQDVVYAKPGIKPLKYDVYSPKGAKNLPCIVIIHGGGWSSNNEDIMRGLARELAKGNHYVVFSIDYRWVNKLDGDAEPTYMHKLIEDVFGAIAHIQEHAAQYGGDPTRIAVTGDSAGGHLAECAAVMSTLIGDGGFGKNDNIVFEYKPTYIPKGKTTEQVKTEITNAIKAVAPSYGPSNAKDFKQFVEQDNEYYLNAISPDMHVPNRRERRLPHYIVRGTEDPLITNEMIQNYVDLLKATEQPVKYVQVEGASHAFFDWKPDATTIGTFKKYGVKYADEMRMFFDGVFYNKE
jgi:acetyl esterase